MTRGIKYTIQKSVQRPSFILSWVRRGRKQSVNRGGYERVKIQEGGAEERYNSQKTLV